MTPPLTPVFPAQPNSPDLTLAAPIDATATEIRITGTPLPAPNTLTIRLSDDDPAPEVIYYPVDPVDGVLTGVTRGFEGAAKSFPQGAKICRGLTAYELNALAARDVELLGLINNISLPSSGWIPVTAFSGTPASTSTITTTSDLTGTLRVGAPLRYTLGGTYYYGIITAIRYTSLWEKPFNPTFLFYPAL